MTHLFAIAEMTAEKARARASLIWRLGWGCCVVLAAPGCGDGEAPLPPVSASSKYIDYATYADASVICMGDTLAREDRFIEGVTAFLGIPVPTGRIRFVFNPHQASDVPQPFACDTASSCYNYTEADDTGTIVSSNVVNHHELVHAAEIPVLGADGHRMLIEGLADYLGTSNSSAAILDNFPTAFKEMIAEDPMPNDYRLAMHFVGSIIEKYGVDSYKALRKSMPSDGGTDELAVAFDAVYHKSMDVALAEMTTPIRGVLPYDGCVGDDAERIEWTEPRLINRIIDGECGDPWFVGAGFSENRAGFAKVFVIEVTEGAWYEFSLKSPSGAVPHPEAVLHSCDETDDGSVSVDGLAGSGILYPGRHSVTVGFPQGPEARGEALLRLEYFAPL